VTLWYTRLGSAGHRLSAQQYREFRQLDQLDLVDEAVFAAEVRFIQTEWEEQLDAQTPAMVNHYLVRRVLHHTTSVSLADREIRCCKANTLRDAIQLATDRPGHCSIAAVVDLLKWFQTSSGYITAVDTMFACATPRHFHLSGATSSGKDFFPRVLSQEFLLYMEGAPLHYKDLQRATEKASSGASETQSMGQVTAKSDGKTDLKYACAPDAVSIWEAHSILLAQLVAQQEPSTDVRVANKIATDGNSEYNRLGLQVSYVFCVFAYFASKPKLCFLFSGERQDGPQPRCGHLGGLHENASPQHQLQRAGHQRGTDSLARRWARSRLPLCKTQHV
jgi:hypothetical protein